MKRSNYVYICTTLEKIEYIHIFENGEWKKQQQQQHKKNDCDANRTTARFTETLSVAASQGVCLLSLACASSHSRLCQTHACVGVYMPRLLTAWLKYFMAATKFTWRYVSCIHTAGAGSIHSLKMCVRMCGCLFAKYALDKRTMAQPQEWKILLNCFAYEIFFFSFRAAADFFHLTSFSLHARYLHFNCCLSFLICLKWFYDWLICVAGITPYSTYAKCWMKAFP